MLWILIASLVLNLILLSLLAGAIRVYRRQKQEILSLFDQYLDAKHYEQEMMELDAEHWQKLNEQRQQRARERGGQ